MIAGVLPEIADDLSVSEAAAGQLVTAFSVTYALAAPPLAVATARLPRKTLLVGGLAAFAAVNLLTALAPGYGALLVARVAAALLAAVLTPAAFGLAGRLAEPERVGRAIGVVAAGLTVSLFVGVPLGSLLASSFGWRATFVGVGAFSCAVTLASAALLPNAPGAPALGVRAQLRVLSRPSVLTCVLGTVVGASCGLMVFTYLGPVTEDLTGRGGPVLALSIAVIGVFGAVGTFAGGRLTDRWGPDRALLGMFGLVVSVTALLGVVGVLTDSDVPVWPVAAALAVWGFGAWGFNPPMNARILGLAGDAGTEAVALNTSGLYTGIALGGALGGAALTAYDGPGVTFTAAALGVTSLLLMYLTTRRYPTPPAPGADGAADGPGQSRPEEPAERRA